MPKIKRAGVTYYINIAQKAAGPEYQVRHGNRIISRHATEAEADAALRAIFAR